MFSAPLVVRQLPGYEWVVERPFTYTHLEHEVTIPKGFRTDLGTIPRVLWWWISPAGRHAQACVVHDFMYENAIQTKEDADNMFYAGLIELGVPQWRAKVMYWAVKLFGKGRYV